MRTGRPEDYKEASKRLKKMIRRKKRECCDRFLQDWGKRNPWDVVQRGKDAPTTRKQWGT